MNLSVFCHSIRSSDSESVYLTIHIASKALGVQIQNLCILTMYTAPKILWVHNQTFCLQCVQSFHGNVSPENEWTTSCKSANFCRYRPISYERSDRMFRFHHHAFYRNLLTHLLYTSSVPVPWHSSSPPSLSSPIPDLRSRWRAPWLWCPSGPVQHVHALPSPFRVCLVGQVYPENLHPTENSGIGIAVLFQSLYF
jgi:hypothetical protein